MEGLRLYRPPDGEGEEDGFKLRDLFCPGCGSLRRYCICEPRETLEERYGFSGLDEEELEELLEEFDDDEDMLFGYLWAMSKDD
jgi:hypothetical protein